MPLAYRHPRRHPSVGNTPKPRARKIRRRPGALACPEQSGLVGRGREARGGMENVAWRSHPRPTGEGHSAPSGRRWTSFLREGQRSPGRFRLVRPNRQPNPPMPDPLPASIPFSHDQALSGPASCDAAGAGADQQVSGSGKFLPGCSQSPSFRPAGTVPARQNSPPPAGQNSVSPGHPLGTEGRASVARWQRVWKK